MCLFVYLRDCELVGRKYEDSLELKLLIISQEMITLTIEKEIEII